MARMSTLKLGLQGILMIRAMPELFSHVLSRTDEAEFTPVMLKGYIFDSVVLKWQS